MDDKIKNPLKKEELQDDTAGKKSAMPLTPPTNTLSDTPSGPPQTAFGPAVADDKYAPVIRYNVFIGILDILIGAVALIFLFIKLGKVRFDLFAQYTLIVGVVFLAYGILKITLAMLAQKNSALLSKLTARDKSARTGSPEVRSYAMAFKVFMPTFAVALIPIGEIFSLTAFIVALGVWIAGMVVFIVCRAYYSIIK